MEYSMLIMVLVDIQNNKLIIYHLIYDSPPCWLRLLPSSLLKREGGFAERNRG